MKTLARVLRALPLLVISPLLALLPALALLAVDALWALLGKRRPRADRRPTSDGASIVIPTWNGCDLLEKYLPAVISAVAANPRNEIIVVDNGSTDGTAQLIRLHFPSVRLVALERNLGFGGGSNAGIRAARNDVVVMLNNDMRVEPDFLAPLLEGFTDPDVFAVSCQIFFSDPQRRREETGLTQGWWESGALRLRHRVDPAIRDLYPCIYGGGGSCAFDRLKFLELGGFDSLLEPFYMEDTDLGYLAWKRGWKVLYQPRSVVYHEHRGTIGRRFSLEQIDAVLKKNLVLFCWKNIHDWRRLAPHFAFTFAGALMSVFIGDSPERSSLSGMWRAFLSLPWAIRSRWAARRLATISDTETLARPLGGYFRDRFSSLPVRPDTLRVLFVSPYPICPPVHGGGVFMYQTTRELAALCDLHLVVLLDYAHEQAAHDDLVRQCASAEFLVRVEGKAKQLGSITPHAVREFSSGDLEWLIHRQILTREIDVVQIEYTNMAQYAGSYRQLAAVLFEHDIYFQSIARGLRQAKAGLIKGWNLRALQAGLEYLRALRYELRMLPRLDRVQVCSRENGDYLLEFAPRLAPKLQAGLRAGIDTASYRFQADGREPDTLLFLGSFRHQPNQDALQWFAHRVMREVLRRRPRARLVVIGSDPPPRHALPDLGDAIELRGFVEDVHEPLERYAVFVCPILSGSGVRVKLLEAFAAGIPVVSTRLGAEGLAREDGHICALADDPNAFADRVADLLEQPERAAEMAGRARAEVEANWDMRAITKKLVESYRQVIEEKRQRRTPSD